VSALVCDPLPALSSLNPKSALNSPKTAIGKVPQNAQKYGKTPLHLPHTAQKRQSKNGNSGATPKQPENQPKTGAKQGQKWPK